MNWRILCESPDLAVQCLTASQQLQLSIETEVEADPCQRAIASAAASEPVALALLTPPSLGTLVELASASRGRAQPFVVAIPVPSERRTVVIDVASELGMYAVAEIRPLLALLALLERDATEAFCASVRALSPTDRARLKSALASSKASAAAGHLSSLPDARIGWAASQAGDARPLGEAWETSEALVALRRRERQRSEVLSSVDVDARAVLDVIFGPRRALSDPASKAALAPYGIPLPVEELCSSPSRAAAEAARIGYPVRISLASPELRVWDHPDLCVDMVDNAPRVRDTFRQLMAAAHQRLGNPPGADDRRVLGVMVTVTSEASALLGVRATPLPQARVAAEIGFADPHGRASADTTITILPAEAGAIERALQRLAGNALLLSAAPALRKARVEAITDVLLRLAAFVNDRRREIEAVEVRPLAVLLDGSVEVREACISVGDYFERSLVDPGSETVSRRA